MKRQARRDPLQDEAIRKPLALMITGENCSRKPTILRTYKEPPNANVKPVGQTSAVIDGNGHVEYQVYGDYSTHMTSRIGVPCGFGDCGR
ncbi:hypothetical protein COOONC_24673 [Cooperia oncophora]